MKMKNILSTATVIATVFLFAGCNLRKSNPLDLSNPADIDVPALSADQITYKVIDSQILQDHCVSCHSEKGGNKGDVNLETYENVFKEAQSIRTEVLGKSMPPGRFPNLKLSDAQIRLVVDWIDAGAKETVGDQTPIDQPPVVQPGTSTPVTGTPPVIDPGTSTPVTGPVYFAEVFEKVIKTNCTSCHSVQGGNKGKVNLETYAAVFAVRDDMQSDIQDNTMPPRRGTPLTADQKKLILDWLNAGAKEKADDGVQQPPPVIVPPPTATPVTGTPPVVVPPTGTPPVIEPPVTADVVFADIMEKVLKTNCLKCHSQAGGNRGDVNLETYASVMEALPDVKDDVETNQMPPKPPKGTPLTDEQKQMLLSWIEKGAKEK